MEFTAQCTGKERAVQGENSGSQQKPPVSQHSTDQHVWVKKVPKAGYRTTQKGYRKYYGIQNSHRAGNSDCAHPLDWEIS